MSLAAATCAGDATTWAPKAFTSLSRPGLRFHTVSVKPARARLAAIGAPIVPRARNPFRGVVGSAVVMSFSSLLTTKCGRGSSRTPSNVADGEINVRSSASFLGATIETTVAPKFGVALHISSSVVGLIIVTHLVTLVGFISVGNWLILRRSEHRLFLTANAILNAVRPVFESERTCCGANFSGRWAALMVPLCRIVELDHES